MSQVSGAEHPTKVAAARRAVIDFLIYGNIHILFVALGLILGTYLLTETSPNLQLMVAGCCGAFLVYQIDRVIIGGNEDPINHPGRTVWLNEHRSLVFWFFVLFSGVGLLAASSLPWQTLAMGFGLAILGIAYLLPIIPGRIRPKSIWFIKPLVIASAWSVGTVLFPALDADVNTDSSLIGLFFYRWFFILPNVLLADWQDRAGDKLHGIVSLATLVSEKHLRLIAGFCALLSIGAGLMTGFLAGWPGLYFLDIVGPAVFILICSRPLPRSSLYFVLFIDLLIAWPLITYLLSWIA